MLQLNADAIKAIGIAIFFSAILLVIMDGKTLILSIYLLAAALFCYIGAGSLTMLLLHGLPRQASFRYFRFD